MGSFGHCGHMPNQSNSSSFAPIAPETAPEDRPHFFQGSVSGASRKPSRYGEGRGKELRPPKELKELADKMLAASSMLEDAVKHYTTALKSLEVIEAKGEKPKFPPDPDLFPYDKRYTIHHNRAMCHLEMRNFALAVEVGRCRLTPGFHS